MRLVSRYVGMQVAMAILLVLTVILSLDLLGALLDEVGRLEGDYGFLQALVYLMQTAPARLTGWLPFAALVGALAGLGSLANNSELTVMRAAGVSTGRIIWIVIRPTLLFILAGVLINEYIAPGAEKSAMAEREALRSEGQSFSISQSGFWNREGNDFMHVNGVWKNQTMIGVVVYRFDDNFELYETVTGMRGDYQPDKGNWLIAKVTHTAFGDDEIVMRELENWEWNTTFTPELLGLVALRPQQLSITGLWDYASYRRSQGLEAAPYELAFWSKVLQPLSIISLVLVAISFIFGPLREVTMGYRVFAGVIVGIVFWTLQELLGPSSLVFKFPPLHAVLLPIALSFGLGVFLLRKV